MKRIAIDMRMINNSGIGRYLRDIVPGVIEGLPEIKFYLLGHEPVLSDFSHSVAGNIEVVQMNSPIYSLSEQFEGWRLLRRDLDLLWVPHYNIPIAYPGRMLVTIHDVFHLAMQRTLRLDQKLYARLMFKMLKRNADEIICVSQFSKNELIKFTHFPANKVHVVHNGLAVDWFESRFEKFDRDTPNILFVGNVKPHKNIRRLLQAFRKIAAQTDCNLQIVGKKDGFITGESGLEKFIAGMEDRVHFTGFISDDELKKCYAQARLFVFPSTYEGFGFPPLEAMACGCPVLASSIGAVQEVCDDAVAYCNPDDVFDIAEKMVILLQDEFSRSELIEKGFHRAQQFSLDNCVRKTGTVIGGMIGEPFIEKEFAKVVC